MNFKNMITSTEKPEIYATGTSTMWTDEYISQQLLSVHLNADIDLASRKKTSIDKTTEWILKEANGKNLEILDLGCGPGLYTQKFAKKGHNVTGIDFSKCSINYAKSEAKKENLEINYINQNYLELEFENKFDLVIMIYTDFGVLLPDERENLLFKINKALKPEGKFIFDVLSDHNIEQKVTPKNWELEENGFWKNRPYLNLSNSFYYHENKVILYQHTLIDEENNLDVYRFWTHFFSEDNLQAILEKHSFHDIKFHNNVLPKGDLWNGDDVTFCTVSKRNI